MFYVKFVCQQVKSCYFFVPECKTQNKVTDRKTGSVLEKPSCQSSLTVENKYRGDGGFFFTGYFQ